MKALIVSDTHGSLENLKKVIEIEKPDRVIHCGDSHNQEDRIAECVRVPLDIVGGNCDGGFMLPNELVTTAMGKRIFVTHGHLYGVYSGIQTLAREAKARECEIVFYGHTHVPDIEYYDGLRIVCPGSLKEPRQPSRIPTYAIMEEREDGEINIKIVEIK